MTTWRRGIVPRLLVLQSIVLAVACSGDEAPPTRLVDGSPARAAAKDLEGVSMPTIATRVDVVSPTRAQKGSVQAKCLASSGDAPGRVVVTRVGVSGRSITYGSESGRALHACDGTSTSQPPGRWCGAAAGRLEAGSLTDPRLDLACTTAAGDPVAFVWVEPGPDSVFVAVRQRGFTEVYETTSDLPVRVTTTAGIALEESSAWLEVSEHDRQGALLREYTLDARVAG